MAGPDFVYLNDQAVRATSLHRDDATGAFTLVVIARGSGDRDTTQALLEARPLTLRIPDEGEFAVVAREIDLRSSGEGPRAFYRFSAVLVPAQDARYEETLPGLTIEQRLTSLEQRLDQIVAMLEEIRGQRSR